MGKLKKKILSSLIGIAASLGLAGGLEAEIIQIDKVTDLVEKASNYGGESRTYETDNLTYSGEVPDKKIILFAYKDYEGFNFPMLIGGLENNITNPRNPKNIGTGFINKQGVNCYPPGLDFGDIIGNTRQGANISGGFFGARDINENGYIGIYDTLSGQLTFEPGEYIAPYKVEFSGFQEFPESGTAAIDYVNIAPQNSCIRNINFDVYPVNPDNGTEWKTSFIEFDFVGDRIFTPSSGQRWKLDAKYKVSFLIDDGDGNYLNDEVVEGGVVENHVVYCFDNQQAIEHYVIDEPSSIFNGDYMMHGFMFGGPDFTLPQDGPSTFNLYAKIENLETGDFNYIQFNPSYSENIEVYKTPEPATLGFLGLGLSSFLFRKRLRKYRQDKKSA
jgi:hypothetical protein